MQKNKSKYTDRYERIQKRHNDASGIPYGSRVVDADGLYWRRQTDGFHLEGADYVVGPLSMAYPLKRLAETVPGVYLDRNGRRQVEREGARAKYLFARSRNRQARANVLAAYQWSRTGEAPFGKVAVLNADGSLKAFRQMTDEELAAQPVTGSQRPVKGPQTAAKRRGHVVGADGVEATL